MAVLIPVTVTEPVGVSRRNEPVRSGIAFARGALRSPDELVLIDERGERTAVQFESLSKWDDGSQRWVLLNFLQSLDSNETRRFELRSGVNVEPPAAEQTVHVAQADDVYTVDTGAVKFEVPIYGRAILTNLMRRDESNQWRRVSRHGLEAIVRRSGVMPFKSYVEKCVVESAGPIKAVLKIEGHHYLWGPGQDQSEPSQDAAFAFVARVFCWAGSDEIRLQYTFINDHRDGRVRPSERYHSYALEELRDYEWVNGRWVDRPKGMRFRERELLDDDYGQVPIKWIKLRLNLDDAYSSYRLGVLGGEPAEGAIDGPVALQQVGPVPDYDQFFKEMPFPHTPFRATVLHGRGEPVCEFDKAAGWIDMRGGAASLLFAGKYFWQYHPKVLACDTESLEYFVWNRLEDLPHPEIGFAKTHEVTLRPGAADEACDADASVAALHHPLRALTTPQHYIDADVFGTIAPSDHERFELVEKHLLQSARQEQCTIEERNLYGVRDFGDTFGVRCDVPIAWNQEYDPMLGAAVQFARTADRFYLDRADVLAWHLIDVDVLHASNSELNEGGQHMHFTDHAKGETHAGHGTVEGLWHYYMLTGEPRAGEVAAGIGDYFAKVAAWKDFLDFRDDEERTIGWALRALVASHQATGHARYKLAAQMVIEQAIAGQDPVTGNWDHPLYPNEDKHRPTCVGGKPWMVGIILAGMKRYHRAFGDVRVHEMILRAADWIVASNYAYMTCPDHKPLHDGLCQHLDALSYAWELSGKRYYIDEASAIFDHTITRWAESPTSGWLVQGPGIEEIANMLRVIGEHGDKVWQEEQPVLDPQTTPIVEQMRADPRFKAKPKQPF